jgi:hypothetical protein
MKIDLNMFFNLPKFPDIDTDIFSSQQIPQTILSIYGYIVDLLEGTCPATYVSTFFYWYLDFVYCWLARDVSFSLDDIVKYLKLVATQIRIYIALLKNGSKNLESLLKDINQWIYDMKTTHLIDEINSVMRDWKTEDAGQFIGVFIRLNWERYFALNSTTPKATLHPPVSLIKPRYTLQASNVSDLCSIIPPMHLT